MNESVPKSQNHKEQLEKLSSISTQLEDINHFVLDQKKHIIREQEILDKLAQSVAENDSLISLNQETANIIVKRAVAEQEKTLSYLQLVISFLIGVASSATVVFIVNIYKRGAEKTG